MLIERQAPILGMLTALLLFVTLNVLSFQSTNRKVKVKDSLESLKEILETNLRQVQSRSHKAAKSQCTSNDVITVYVVTPTYARASQRADVTSLVQTLAVTCHVHIIIAEDAPQPSPWIRDLLVTNNVSHTHLACETDAENKRKNLRGKSQRNCALAWLRSANTTTGVIYFADDDNTFDHRLFDHLRLVKSVGLIPTGLIGNLGVSAPVVRQGKVDGFKDVYPGRRYAVDMASIVVSVPHWLQVDAPLFTGVIAGFQESAFMTSLKVKPRDLEPLLENCTKIMAWHTRSQSVTVKTKTWQSEILLPFSGLNTNLIELTQHITLKD